MKTISVKRLICLFGKYFWNPSTCLNCFSVPYTHVYIPIQTALWSEKYTSKTPESTGVMLLNIRSIVEWWNLLLLHGIWLVIRLGQEIMLTNNVTKFDDDPLKNIEVKERTRFILAILANSRAITPKCFMGSGWLSNLAEIFCQQTFLQSLMIIQWKILKLLSGQILWTPPTLRTCSHNVRTRAYKKGFTLHQ